jgi:hypothetical protein
MKNIFQIVVKMEEVMLQLEVIDVLIRFKLLEFQQEL